jgi:hypothetical protein
VHCADGSMMLEHTKSALKSNPLGKNPSAGVRYK